MIFRAVAALFMLFLIGGCSPADKTGREVSTAKEVILTDGSPTPGGPYSQAIAAGNLVCPDRKTRFPAMSRPRPNRPLKTSGRSSRPPVSIIKTLFGERCTFRTWTITAG